MKKKKGYLSGAGILAAAVVFAKVLGAAYRIPLANMIGAEGMGLYQFVYPVFALLLTLSSGSVPTAVSISVSELVSQNREEEAKKFFSTALKISLLIGLGGSLLLASIAYPVSLLQSKEAFLGYLTISPAVLIVTLVSAFRGWFTGHGDLLPSSLSQLTEGVVKIGVGLLLTHLLLPYGLPFAVVGALAGVTTSELVTLLIMAIIYRKKHKNFLFVSLREEKPRLQKLGKIMLPLILCGMILPLSQFIDSLLIVNLLKLSGSESATADYGVWTGMVSPLINLPVMVCISLGIAVTPQMVESRTQGDVEMILKKSDTSVKLTFFLGIPFMIVYLIMAEKILGLLYPGVVGARLTTAAVLLRINAVSVLGLSLFQIYSAMLQGLERIKVPVKIMALSMTVKLLLSLILTPLFGIVGAAIASTAGNLLAGCWITVYFVHFTRLEKRLIKNVSLIVLCGAIMGMLIFLTNEMQSSIVGVALVGIAAAILYFVAVLVFGVFSQEEWKAMPLSGLFTKLDKKINGG